uniref:Uncharacterized protein n=1 Tax=Trichuris muris TaxID=70415 RepID=A0A5S6QYX3_TRIMR
MTSYNLILSLSICCSVAYGFARKGQVGREVASPYGEALEDTQALCNVNGKFQCSEMECNRLARDFLFNQFIKELEETESAENFYDCVSQCCTERRHAAHYPGTWIKINPQRTPSSSSEMDVHKYDPREVETCNEQCTQEERKYEELLAADTPIRVARRSDVYRQYKRCLQNCFKQKGFRSER